MRRNGYKGRALIEEFKRGLNEVLRRLLGEAEKFSERIVQLDCNMKQVKAKERILRVEVV